MACIHPGLLTIKCRFWLRDTVTLLTVLHTIRFCQLHLKQVLVFQISKVQINRLVVNNYVQYLWNVIKIIIIILTAVFGIVWWWRNKHTEIKIQPFKNDTWLALRQQRLIAYIEDHCSGLLLSACQFKSCLSLQKLLISLWWLILHQCITENGVNNICIIDFERVFIYKCTTKQSQT